MHLPRCLTVRSTVVDTTSFACPSCGGDRLAAVHDGRRQLRAGPLPVLPLPRVHPHLTCTGCEEEHPLSALDRMTSASLAAVLADTDRCLAALVVRTGDVDDRDLRRRAVQHVRTAVPTYDQNQLDRDLARLDPLDASAIAAPLADELAVAGKERIVADLVRVALAAHTITPAQRRLIDAVGTALGLTPLHLTGIVTGVAAAVEPPADHP